MAENAWRRRGAGGLVGRLTDQLGTPSPELQPDVIDLLFTVASFETFDVLAGADKTPADAVPLFRHLARAALSLPARRRQTATR